MKTGILLIATKKYNQFVPQMVESIRKYIPDAKIFLFSDQFHEGVDEVFAIEAEPWPYPTLLRYQYFLQHEHELDTDYLYYVDVDARFVDEVDIIGDLVAVRHCGYFFKDNPPEETNPNSIFYGCEFQKYYGGGFQGGIRSEFIELCYFCRDHINIDLDKGVMPLHHDETSLNYYLNCIKHPTLELTPDYHYPELDETNRDWFINHCWNGSDPFNPKILLLNKNHKEIRS